MEWMLKDYARLIKMEARVNALMNHVRNEKYSVDKKLICDILGFDMNEVEDGESGKQDAEMHRGFDGSISE